MGVLIRCDFASLVAQHSARLPDNTGRQRHLEELVMHVYLTFQELGLPSSDTLADSLQVQCRYHSPASKLLTLGPCADMLQMHYRYFHPHPPQRAVKNERTFEGISLDTPGQSSRQVMQMSRFQLCATCYQRESNPSSGTPPHRHANLCCMLQSVYCLYTVLLVKNLHICSAWLQERKFSTGSHALYLHCV